MKRSRFSSNVGHSSTITTDASSNKSYPASQTEADVSHFTAHFIPKNCVRFRQKYNKQYVKPLRDRAIMCQSTGDPRLAPVTFFLISSVIKMPVYFLALCPHFVAFYEARLLEATTKRETSAEPRALGSVSSTIRTLQVNPA